MAALSKDPFHHRLRQLQKQLAKSETSDGLLISLPSDLEYFTGRVTLVASEREAYCLVTRDHVWLIQSSFSPLSTASYLKILEPCFPNALARHLTTIAKNHHLNRILIDERDLTVAEYQTIAAQVQEVAAVETFSADMLWQLRMIKDKAEQIVMTKAAEAIVQVVTEVRQNVKTNMTEHAVARQIDTKLRALGAEPAFPTIVAFGAHSALPHHQPGSTKLKTNTPILIDAGAKIDRYCSDMTQTFWFGKNPSPTFLKLEKIIHDAYDTGFRLLVKHAKAPISAQALDASVRAVITDVGFGPQFIHTTGHGLGLDIHEPPSLNYQNEQLLKPGMCITLEPGIYLPGELGYRYEHTVLLTPKSARELTKRHDD